MVNKYDHMFNKERYFFTESNKFKWSLAFSVSSFSVLVLIVFQPFGINNYNHESNINLEWLFYIFSIGLVAFLVIIINEFFLRSLVRLKPTLFWLLIWFFWEFVLVGSALFFYYNFLGGFHDLTIYGWLVFLLNTLFVVALPYFGIIFFFNYRALKKEFSEVLTPSNQKSKLDDILFISGDYKKDEIALSPRKIIIIKSEDNYAALHYLEDSKIKVHLIRSSLSSMEKSFSQPSIIRCNRSVIVNLDWTDFYQKQGSKFIIKVKHYPEEILITNKYLERVKEYLDNQIKNT